MTRAICLEGVQVLAADRVLLQIQYLEIRSGERVAIVGPNGSGKSTLLKLMGQMLVPQHGMVEVLGRRLAPVRLKADESRALRRETGLLMQGLHLVPRLSARENVLIGALGRLHAWDAARSLLRWYPPACIAQADAALAALGLAERADTRADRLSGGERQKVALARVQLQGPRLLLADEPTSALDPAATAQMCAALTATTSAADQTLITVVHDPELLPLLATRVLGLAGGRLQWDHEVNSLTPSLLQRLYEPAPVGLVAESLAPAAPEPAACPGPWGWPKNAH